MEPFRYKPLTGSNSTRVFKLSPWGGHILKGSLMEVDLDSRPSYEAASYSWGGEPLSRYLICEGRTIPISPTCEAFLRQVRRNFVTRSLWVDIICIDQSSVAERNLQVFSMDKIYSRAQRTLVWLGEGNARSEVAFEILEWLALIPLMPKKIAGRVADLDFDGTKKNSAEFAVENKVLRDALFDVFGRPWWSRTWTLQEVALAPKATVLCGKRSMDWLVLELALAIWRDKQHNNPYLYTPSHVMAVFDLHRELARSVHKKLARKHIVKESVFWEPMTYVELLSQIRQKNVTDLRDKVYGLTGLFKTLGMPIVEPQYADSHTPQQAYIAAARLALETKDGIEILYELGQRELPGLPSWVPDLSYQRQCTVGTKTFDASKNHQPFYKLDKHGDGLYCRCAVIDTVQAVASQDLTNGDEGIAGQFSAVLQEWSRMSNSLPSYPSTDSIEEAFCKTLVHDTFEEAIRVSNAFNETTERLSLGGTGHHETQKSAIDYVKAHRNFMTAVAAEAEQSRREAVVPVAPEHALSEGGRASHIDDNPAPTLSPMDNLDVLAYDRNLRSASVGLTFFTTERGYMGTTLPNVRPGDAVILIAGLRVPFLARKLEGKRRTYSLLTSAFIQGVMYGESWPEYEDKAKKEKEDSTYDIGSSAEATAEDGTGGDINTKVVSSDAVSDSARAAVIAESHQVERDASPRTTADPARAHTPPSPPIPVEADEDSDTSWDADCDDELKFERARTYFAQFAPEGTEHDPVQIMGQAFFKGAPAGLDFKSESFERAASDLMRSERVRMLRFI